MKKIDNVFGKAEEGQHPAIASRRHTMRLTPRSLKMTLDDFRQSVNAAKPPRAIGLGPTNLLSRTKAPRVRECRPTCIARKAIRTTQPTGMVGPFQREPDGNRGRPPGLPPDHADPYLAVPSQALLEVIL